MKIDQPVPVIKIQSQINTPITSDATLVDDLVALVDDPVALVGGNTVIHPNIASKVVLTVPRPVIKVRR